MPKDVNDQIRRTRAGEAVAYRNLRQWCHAYAMHHGKHLDPELVQDIISNSIAEIIVQKDGDDARLITLLNRFIKRGQRDLVRFQRETGNDERSIFDREGFHVENAVEEIMHREYELKVMDEIRHHQIAAVEKIDNDRHHDYLVLCYQLRPEVRLRLKSSSNVDFTVDKNKKALRAAQRKFLPKLRGELKRAISRREGDVEVLNTALRWMDPGSKQRSAPRHSRPKQSEKRAD